MEKDKILALDLGSTGIKVTVFDRGANILGSRYGEYQTLYPGINMVLQSPTEWWRYFCDATKDLLHALKISPQEIACVAPSGQMSALIPIDEEGELLMDPCLIWADMRVSEQVQEVAEGYGGQDKVYDRTGIGLTEETFTGYKIKWFHKEMPALYARTRYFLQPKEYIGFRLTGNVATDYSDASETAMMDIRERTWSEDMLRLMDIDREKLPPIKHSWDALGKITKEAAKECGLAEGTLVCVGGGDVSIAASGAGIREEGSCYFYIGSGSWVGISSKEPLLDYRHRIACLCSVSGDGYFPHMIGLAGGLSHQWARNLFNDIPGVKGNVDYGMIEGCVARSAIGANGLLFLPYLRGGGAPNQNINARGAFIGLEARHTYDDLCRSIMEGVAFILREMLEVLDQKCSAQIKEVILIGGGAKSAAWRQIIADVIGRPIICTSMKQEANTWGAAKLGGICAGLWESFEEAEKLVKVESVTRPRQETKGVYDGMYQAFFNAYEHLVPTFEELARCRVEIEDLSKEEH